MSKYLLPSLFYQLITPLILRCLARTIDDEGLQLILSVIVAIMPGVARLVLVKHG